MLFNSYGFLFVFLPVCLAGYAVAAGIGRRSAALWLIAASLVFYAWWNLDFLPVLLISMLFNYGASILLARPGGRRKTAILAAAIGVNIAALFYYKYFAAMMNMLHAPIAGIALPLGISFFTFTQIGYLVDVAQGVAQNRGALQYAQFVTFFPHLIAGPILHNREIMPQFARARGRPSATDLAAGSMIFTIGLLKKTLLADPLAPVVAPGFLHPAAQPFFAAWHTALGYSLQLYFDFSGYSDMAIGLARSFGIIFPLNFNSPYRAASIIEYWQRWHMTLSRYLNVYLYNPVALAVARRRLARGLGTSRKAHATAGGFAALVALPTIFTMFLAGLWHGAGWQFLVFGLLHAAYLTTNHAWRIFGPKRMRGGHAGGGHAAGVALTYLCVVVAAIFFRAGSCTDAFALLGGMTGLHGIDLMATPMDLARRLLWLGLLYGIVWFMPNTQQIMRITTPALGHIAPGPIAWLEWRPRLPWAILAGLGASLGVLALGGTTEFLYFRF